MAASLVAEHRLQTRMLSNCGPRAQPLRGMWDPTRPGLEPVSSALAGRFSTTVPPGKPHPHCLNGCFSPSLSPPPFSWMVLSTPYSLSAYIMRCTCIVKLALSTLVRKYTLGKGKRETFRSQSVFLNNMVPKQGPQDITSFYGQASVLT